MKLYKVILYVVISIYSLAKAGTTARLLPLALSLLDEANTDDAVPFADNDVKIRHIKNTRGENIICNYRQRK